MCFLVKCQSSFARWWGLGGKNIQKSPPGSRAIRAVSLWLLLPQRCGREKKKNIMGYKELHHLKGARARCCGVALIRVYTVNQLCNTLNIVNILIFSA